MNIKSDKSRRIDTRAVAQRIRELLESHQIGGSPKDGGAKEGETNKCPFKQY